jgi:hypothetical protein
MSSLSAPQVASLEEAAALAPEQILDLVRAQVALRAHVDTLQQQLDWVKRQAFGQRSERRIVDDALVDASLG